MTTLNITVITLILLTTSVVGNAYAQQILETTDCNEGDMLHYNNTDADGLKWNCVTIEDKYFGSMPIQAQILQIYNTLYFYLNNIGSFNIVDNSLQSVDIKDNDIKSVDIKDNDVQSVDILDNDVQSVDIKDGTIQSVDIAVDAVLSGHIKNNNVQSVDILDNNVQSVDIKDGTIQSADIASGGVQSVDILNNDVQSVDIKDNDVHSGDILDGTIQSVDITDHTITGTDIFGTTKLLFNECLQPGQQINGDSAVSLNCTVPGAIAGDNVIVNITNSGTSQVVIVKTFVSAANTVSIEIRNTLPSNINTGQIKFSIIVFNVP